MHSFHVPITTVHGEPDQHAECVTEGLFGEDYSILEEHDNGWLRIRLHRDKYTGFIQGSVNCSQLKTNYRVCSRSTLLFEAPSIKGRVVWRLPFNAELNIVDSDTPEFRKTADGFYVWRDHVCPVSTIDKRDPVSLAEACYLGAPYVWGGCTPAGADCSGMVQSVLHACGHSLPRDSHQQEQAIDQLVSYEQRQRGDLVFWPGHVGLLTSSNELLHATAHSLDCCVEPLSSITTARAGEISSIRRLTQIV